MTDDKTMFKLIYFNVQGDYLRIFSNVTHVVVRQVTVHVRFDTSIGLPIGELIRTLKQNVNKPEQTKFIDTHLRVEV